MLLTPAINLSPVTTKPAINLLPVIRVCGVSMGVSMDASFHGDLHETIGGCVRLRRQEVMGFDGFDGLKDLWGLPLIRVCEVSMDGSFHGGSNDNIVDIGDRCSLMSLIGFPLFGVVYFSTSIYIIIKDLCYGYERSYYRNDG